jgi:hypothetical protein
MAFLKSRNEKLDPRYDKIAVDYMRHGERLGLRWDAAFFQMVIETGYLTYMRDGRKPGDVKPSQNNFAGLGATGRGERGESFKTVSDGVLAHLQHILMYAGEKIENPVAERTRKIQEWGVLDGWRSKLKGPMTFDELASRWANTRGYGDAIAAHAERFFSDECKQPDPAPELLAEAREGKATVAAAERSEIKPEARDDKSARKTEATDRESESGHVSGAELARRALEEGRAEEGARRTGLGAGALVAKASEPVKPAAESGAEGGKDRASGATPVIAASAAITLPPRALSPGSAPPAKSPPAADSPSGRAALATPPKSSACKVFTASYGGVRAILIKSVDGSTTTFTVLDVNEGNERRETDAYIAAYARGGNSIGDFASPEAALDKAFELCPEG